MPKRRLRVIPSKVKYADWAKNHGASNEPNSERPEPPEANGDVLSEEQGYTARMQRGEKTKKCMRLLDNAIRHLTGRQREAYMAYYRNGKTETEIAEEMDITQQSVSELLRRALDFIGQWVKMHGGQFDE